jgi:hypothetical protein
MAADGRQSIRGDLQALNYNAVLKRGLDLARGRDKIFVVRHNKNICE